MSDADQGRRRAGRDSRSASLIYTGSIDVTWTMSSPVGRPGRADVAAGLVASSAATSAASTATGPRRQTRPAGAGRQVRRSALDELAKLGTEESRAVQTEDVTEQLVDLDARLATQRASVDRVRALLARASTIGEVVSHRVRADPARGRARLARAAQGAPRPAWSRSPPSR